MGPDNLHSQLGKLHRTACDKKLFSHNCDQLSSASYNPRYLAKRPIFIFYPFLFLYRKQDGARPLSPPGRSGCPPCGKSWSTPTSFFPGCKAAGDRGLCSCTAAGELQSIGRIGRILWDTLFRVESMGHAEGSPGWRNSANRQEAWVDTFFMTSLVDGCGNPLQIRPCVGAQPRRLRVPAGGLKE